MTWNPISFRSRKKVHIYFVEAPSLSLIKIGITTNLTSRLLLLDSNSPVELRLALAITGTRLQERGLHRFFAADRRRGEWFTASNEMRSFIERAEVLDERAVARLLQKIQRDTQRKFGSIDRFPGRRSRAGARLARIVA